MASPKPGDKRYKGPVHEGVRGIAEAIGIRTNPPKVTPKPAPQRSLRQVPLSEKKGMADNYRRAATSSAKQKGTYDTYDPLSSIKAPTKPKASKTRTMRVGKVKAGAVKRSMRK